MLKEKIYNLLRKSEKYFETDMVYLVKGMSWLTLGRIIYSASTFALAIAFANLLPKETYGTYKYILSLTGILTIFSLPGMETAIIQAAARGYEGSFYQAFKIKLKWGALGSLAALFMAGYYFFKGNHTLPIPLLLSAVFLPLWQASSIYGSLLTGKKLFNFGVKYSAIKQIISVGAMIGALFLSKNIIWIIAAYFVSNTLSNYFLYLLTKKKFQPNKKEDPQTISYGKHLSLMGVIGTIANYLDRILIFHYLGAAEVAIYSIAIAPPEQIKSLLNNIRTLSLPKFSQKSKEEIKPAIFKKIAKLSLFSALVIGAYILFAPLIYKIFFPQYLNSITYSQVFSLSLIFPGILAMSFFESQKAIKEKYIVTFASDILRIVLMFSLVIFFGIWGIIIGRILARFLVFLFSLELVRRLN